MSQKGQSGGSGGQVDGKSGVLSTGFSGKNYISVVSSSLSSVGIHWCESWSD